MKKKVLSILCLFFILCSMVLCVSMDINAQGTKDTDSIVDGSRLTHDDSSRGTSFDFMLKGKHLMDGESAISKAGIGKIYVYGQTTANHDVDFVAVLTYVQRLDEEKDWESVTSYSADKRDTYYVVIDDTIKVERGHYYRVYSEHFAGNDEEEMYDSALSYTDGIWIP